MQDELMTEWMSLGLRLAAAGAEKLDDVVKSLRHIVEAQEILADHDWQLFLRGRPRKRYAA